MQRDDGRDPQGAEKIENVRAVVAAEDAVLVLQGDPAHVFVVDELGGARVFPLGALPDLVLDLGGVFVLAASLGDRDRQRHDAPVSGPHASREIPGERRDPAPARRIGPDESDPEIRIHGGRQPAAGARRRQQNPHSVAAGLIICRQNEQGTRATSGVAPPPASRRTASSTWLRAAVAEPRTSRASTLPPPAGRRAPSRSRPSWAACSC